ncbi:STREFT protein [Mycoplasma putrefaciens]|uniref:Uncharacterized protein n=1 Tax=Mycoplasma putrefaciens (strain ATCC 15718 / NCTC 10155 / C30 KS-1 / KS-1) TaxID=743965 RepID=A0A7U3ZST9_MYCPK|nr:STREFT protein [Mycoplasma putrefaciens]AEM68906.1 uncharacterized protein MPUT_0551 [Mycoplasma putrefaciens KS1]
MIKKLKILKKLYIPILILLIVIGAFLGFILGYSENKKHNLIANIQNYVRLSSYAVRGKILKDQEGINKDYVNKTLANKKIIDEFGPNFIWKQNKSNSSNEATTISNLLQTYFGKSTDLFTDNIKYLDKKDKNKLKDIQKTNTQDITPDNISNFISVVNSAKKFISGLSSSTVNLGINLLQRNFLKTDKEVDAIRNNGGVRGFVNAIESNQGLISTIANLLISSSNDSDSSFYNGLTVKQLFNKQLNEISKIITKKEHNNHNEDHLPNDLIEYFWDEISKIVKAQFDNKESNLLYKIQQILINIKHRFDIKDWIQKLLPALVKYIKTELFFATYYVVNPKLTIEQLLSQSASADQFKSLTKGGLNLGVLLKGLSLVFENQEHGNRFLDFVFKKADHSKVYFTSEKQPPNLGTGNLIFDILNAVQSVLLSKTGPLKSVIPKIQEYIQSKKQDIKDLITKTLTHFLNKYIPGGNDSSGNKDNLWWDKPKFDERDRLKIDIQYKFLLSWYNVASGHIDFFGSKGLLTNLVSGFKNIILSVSDILGTISNYIKHIFYRGKEQSFDFKSAFTNLSNLLKVSNSLLEAQYVADSNREDDLVIYLGLGPHSIAKVYSIYDVLNLPHASVFSNPIIGSLVKKYTGKYLEPFLGVLKKLKDYKFITEVEKFREDFPKYILNSANFIETYYNKNEAIPKYDLIKYLYTKDQNFIANFTKQWASFFVPDGTDQNNPLLPIVKAIFKDPSGNGEKIKTLQDIRQGIEEIGAKLIKGNVFYKNLYSLSNIEVPIGKLASFLGIKELTNIKITELFNQIANVILNNNKKYPNKLIDFNLASLGYILKSLTTKVTAWSKGREIFRDKNILAVILESLDAADNKTKDPEDIENENSYFLWDSVELKLDNKSLSGGEIKINKSDSSASPLSMLLGIGNDKTKYLTGSILHSLSTLIGGLKSNDALYKLSLENKNSLIFGIDAWEEILKTKQKELDKKEYQQAGQYYNNNAWATKLISYNHNQIKYQLIRIHDSNNQYVKKIGKKFEVMLTKQPDNHTYWVISQILALDY